MFATALLRDAKGVAETRPAADAWSSSGRTASNTSARPWPTRGSAGAPSLFRCCPARQPGKWTIAAYADPKGDSDRPGRVPSRGLYSRAARFHAPLRQALHRSGRAGRSLARRAVPLRRAGERARRDRRDPPAGGRRRGAARASPAMSRASPTTSSPPSRTSSPTRSRPTPRATRISRSICPRARRPARSRPSSSSMSPSPAGAPSSAPLTLPVRAKGVMVGVKKDFDESIERRRRRDLRGDRGRPGRLARRAQGRRMVALSGDQRLSVVQRRRALELRAGQVVEAHRERNDRHRAPTRPSSSPRPSAGARIGSRSRRSTARRRASRSTSAGRERRAPTRPTMSSSRSTRRTTRRATRRNCASIRPSPARRRSRSSATGSSASSTSISSRATMSCRSTVGADWGPGAYAVALTHRPLDVAREAHAGPRHRPRLVRHRRRPRASSTSRSRRRRWRGRASR